MVDIEDLEEDDGFCYCEKNPIIEVEHIDMTEPIEENVTFKHVALLYDETEGTYIFFYFKIQSNLYLINLNLNSGYGLLKINKCLTCATKTKIRFEVCINIPTSFVFWKEKLSICSKFTFVCFRRTE